MALVASRREQGTENADCAQASANEGPVDEALGTARQTVRRLLGIHVLEALPERSHILAVDAELPVHDVLTVVLREQHLQLPSQRRPRSGSRGPGAGGDRRSRAGSEDGLQSSAAAANSNETSRDSPAPSLPPLACGAVAPSLPGNVLAEVCEFAAFDQPGVDAATDEQEESSGDSKFRRWTSPDDGWGTQLSSIPMQDLEKMPMSMPVTVGELADFLAHACQCPPPSQDASGEPQRWAQPRADAGEEDAEPCQLEGEDMLDWSLARWRTHRLKTSGEKAPEESAEKDNGQSGDLQIESASRLFVEERPLIAGPVLVHRVFLAPPRPILCTDDPEASLLKVVELLLAYPELDAVPVVSPVRCTVVAHLTLSYCLAFMLGRLRGSDIGPLRELVISANGLGGPPLQRVFDSSLAGINGESGEDACWAESRSGGRLQQLWVLRRSQPLRDLLTFFASTSHNGVPIVEDGSDSSCGGGLLGYLTRRDLLHFLDLAMQCARRRASREGAIPEEEQEVESAEDRAVNFDVEAPVEVVLDTLKRFRQPPASAQAEEARPLPNVGNGTVLVYEEELSLKSLILHILNSGSHKLFFVEAAGEAAPRIRRLLSVGDAWRFLIGEGSVPAATADLESAAVSEPLGGAADGTQVQNIDDGAVGD